MALVKFFKVNETLPASLIANAFYLVKIGTTGFDLYVTTKEAPITAVKIIGGSGGGGSASVGTDGQVQLADGNGAFKASKIRELLNQVYIDDLLAGLDDSKWGLLYNYNAIDDSIINGGFIINDTDWVVPTDADWNTLFTALGGIDIAGGKLKEVGTTNWDANNLGTNDINFSAKGAGYRDTSNNFVNSLVASRFHSSTANGNAVEILSNSLAASMLTALTYFGLSVRLVKPTVNGTAYKKVVTDYEGNNYQVIEVGNQLWLAENLRAKKYVNGAEIPAHTGSWNGVNLRFQAAYSNLSSNNINSLLSTELLSINSAGKLIKLNGMFDKLRSINKYPTLPIDNLGQITSNGVTKTINIQEQKKTIINLYQYNATISLVGFSTGATESRQSMIVITNTHSTETREIAWLNSNDKFWVNASPLIYLSPNKKYLISIMTTETNSLEMSYTVFDLI